MLSPLLQRYHDIADEKLGKVDFPNYTLATPVEQSIVVWADDFSVWIGDKSHYSLIFSFAYVAFILIAKRVMRRRQPLDLRGPLVVWSAFLAVVSIASAARCLQELVDIVYRHSFRHSVCHPSVYRSLSGLWAITFVLSKPLELIDTVFIVVRKRPLIFLHWYHHITVMVYVWYTYPWHYGPCRWYCAMNCTVHAVMYSYYTCRAMQWRVPRAIAMTVTGLQILQMFIGVAIATSALVVVKMYGGFCHVSDLAIYTGLAMYLSYVVLFCQYFYGAYMNKSSGVKRSSTVASNGGTHAYVTSNGVVVAGDDSKKRL